MTTVAYVGPVKAGTEQSAEIARITGIDPTRDLTHVPVLPSRASQVRAVVTKYQPDIVIVVLHRGISDAELLEAAGDTVVLVPNRVSRGLDGRGVESFSFAGYQRLTPEGPVPVQSRDDLA